MWKWIKERFGEWGTIIDWVSRLGVVIVVIGVIGSAVKQWYKGIDTTQLALLLIILFGVLLIIFSAIFRWMNNRSVKNIPSLLNKMDEKMKCLIGTAVPSLDKAMQFLKDAGELWDIDIQRIQTAYTSGNIGDLKTMVKEWENKPSPFPQSSPQPFTLISNFLQSLRGLMMTDEVGTDSIKDIEYKKMEKRLQILQRRLRDSRSIRNLDRYLIWWNGSNHWWLFKHYGENNPIYPLIAPAKAKANIPQFDYLLQVAVNEYLGYVKDSIYNNKEKVKEAWKPIDQIG